MRHNVSAVRSRSVITSAITLRLTIRFGILLAILSDQPFRRFIGLYTRSTIAAGIRHSEVYLQKA
jgi:hypothetical protein